MQTTIEIPQALLATTVYQDSRLAATSQQLQIFADASSARDAALKAAAAIAQTALDLLNGVIAGSTPDDATIGAAFRAVYVDYPAACLAAQNAFRLALLGSLTPPQMLVAMHIVGL
jgi:hypothetical protein